MDADRYGDLTLHRDSTASVYVQDPFGNTVEFLKLAAEEVYEPGSCHGRVTWEIGLETVKALLDRGDDVIAFSRGANILQLDHPKLTRVSGDAKNADDTRTALKDADVVVQTLGVPVSLKLLTGPIDLFSSATRTLIHYGRTQNQSFDRRHWLWRWG